MTARWWLNAAVGPHEISRRPFVYIAAAFVVCVSPMAYLKLRRVL